MFEILERLEIPIFFSDFALLRCFMMGLGVSDRNDGYMKAVSLLI